MDYWVLLLLFPLFGSSWLDWIRFPCKFLKKLNISCTCAWLGWSTCWLILGTVTFWFEPIGDTTEGALDWPKDWIETGGLALNWVGIELDCPNDWNGFVVAYNWLEVFDVGNITLVLCDNEPDTCGGIICWENEVGISW